MRTVHGGADGGKVLCVAAEAGCVVRGVETFGEDGERGCGSAGTGEVVTGGGEVVGFVRGDGKLEEGEFEGGCGGGGHCSEGFGGEM